jgi:hypothetical protein
MKTLTALAFAALMLVKASPASYAGDAQKNTAQTQAATANQQLSIKLLRLRLRAYQTPAPTLMINQ